MTCQFINICLVMSCFLAIIIFKHTQHVTVSLKLIHRKQCTQKQRVHGRNSKCSAEIDSVLHKQTVYCSILWPQPQWFRKEVVHLQCQVTLFNEKESLQLQQCNTNSRVLSQYQSWQHKMFDKGTDASALNDFVRFPKVNQRSVLRSQLLR